MSQLTEDAVKKVAKLAKLYAHPKYVENLSRILDLVEQMSNVDVSNVTPMSHPLEITQPLREDKVTETNERDALQSIAPNVTSGLYLVPKVIEPIE